MKLCISDGLDGFSVSTVCVFQRVSSYVSASRNIKKCFCNIQKCFTSLLLCFWIFLVLPVFAYLISSHIPTQFLLFSLFSLSLLSLIISISLILVFLYLFAQQNKNKKKSKLTFHFVKKKESWGAFYLVGTIPNTLEMY